MDFLFELVFTLLFEGALDIAKNKKISKWVRYPVAVLIALLVVGIFAVVGIVGVFVIIKGEIYIGLVLVALDALIITLGIVKLVKKIKIKRAINEALKEE